MKKLLFAAIAVAIISPMAAQAAWWDFFVGKAAHKLEAVSTSTTQPVFLPSVDDLNKRIAELEQKLQDAQLKIKAMTKSATEAPAKVADRSDVSSVGLSEKQIILKAMPAIVLVETATTTGSGSIIDAEGHVLVDAHTVWVVNQTGAVSGAAESVSVTLASGAKRTARLVGLDEASDIALLKLPEGTAYPFIEPAVYSALQKGDKAYIFGFSNSVPGEISRKSSESIEVVSDLGPTDRGGAVVDQKGRFIGIPGKPSCKVLQDMTTCLKYAASSQSVRARLPKLLDGMRLYKQKRGSSPEEILVRGQLEGMYAGVNESGTINYAISSASGKNSFDYFNSKLGEDQDGKITKIYLTKLKSTAENIYAAVDFLKSKSYDLNIFFINESDSLSALGDYQRKVAKQVESDNKAMLKEYQAKVDLWTKKKNEYDAFLNKQSDVTHDYLMEQGVFIENAAAYLSAEKSRLLNIYSGETVDIF